MHAQCINILVVDDHPFFLEGIRIGIESLEGQCYRVETATSTGKALQHLEKDANFDLILCDLNVPEINGIEFIKLLFEQDFWIPTAIISASENPDDLKRALSEGASGFINKSLNQKDLEAALTLILSGNVYPPNCDELANFELNSISVHDNHAGDHQKTEADKLGITSRQHDVLRLIAQGLTNKEISSTLGIAESTTKSHSKALFQILNVSNRTACTLTASRLNLISDAEVSRQENQFNRA